MLLLFSVEDVDKEKAFAASDDLRQAMENAGINDKPDVYFLNSGFKPGDAKFFSRSHRAAFSKKTGSTPGCFKNIWRFGRPPCRLLRLPKRIGLKSYLRLSALVVKSFLITSSDASTHFRPA